MVLLAIHAVSQSLVNVDRHMQVCISGVGIVGLPACVVTAFQFGIDQRPNALSVNVTTSIAWFVCSLFNGLHLLLDS